MKTSLFYLPSIGSRADIEAGMAGLRGDLYRRMLTELAEQAVLADELGYDSISFTEHHFHVEGFELSNNPVLLDLFIAMQTKRIRSVNWESFCRLTIPSGWQRTSPCWTT